MSFLSDFGLDDEFVGVVHAVCDRVAPGVTVIDVTHGVPAHDVRAGALTLWRAVPWLVPGVVLGVVDPGVGTARRAVALTVAAAGATLVGPDNGLLIPAAHRLGPITEAVEIVPDAGLGPPGDWGATFAGRDVFAPAAARAALGVALDRIGTAVDPASLAGEPVPRPTRSGDVVHAEVLWVDRFGNAQLNATAADLPAPPAAEVLVEVGSRSWVGRLVGSYGDIAPDPVAVVVDSYGHLSICCDRRSAAATYGLAVGQPVRLSRSERHPR
ncbi:MAG: SAM-dependent chlorinase/fluorinase [Acidobacteriota bacterium]|nr:SAM-dependent chlorinase/fluorinase [Acidobacteriota bacterium]